MTEALTNKANRAPCWIYHDQTAARRGDGSKGDQPCRMIAVSLQRGGDGISELFCGHLSLGMQNPKESMPRKSRSFCRLTTDPVPSHIVDTVDIAGEVLQYFLDIFNT